MDARFAWMLQGCVQIRFGSTSKLKILGFLGYLDSKQKPLDFHRVAATVPTAKDRSLEGAGFFLNKFNGLQACQLPQMPTRVTSNTNFQKPACKRSNHG